MVLKQYSEDYELSVGPANLPLLQGNQVLVRLECASASAADIRFLEGHCPVVRALPAVPGFEASGTVVETGSRLKNWRFHGKRVGVFALDSGLPGTWAEYAVVQSRHCFPLIDTISFEQAAGMFLTPLTICMFEEAIGKAKGVIQTGGCSAIARTLLRVCNYKAFACVCVISNPEEAGILVELGARYILLSSDPDFETKAASMCAELAVTVAFDSQGGSVAGQVFNALQPGGALYSYEEAKPAAMISSISPKAFIFERKKIVGLNLFTWFENKHSLQKLHLCNHIQQYYFMYRQEVIDVFPMHEIVNALHKAREVGSQGKIILQLRVLPITKQPSEAAPQLEEEKQSISLEKEEKLPIRIEEKAQVGKDKQPIVINEDLQEVKEAEDEESSTPAPLAASKAVISLDAFPVYEDSEEIEITSQEPSQ